MTAYILSVIALMGEVGFTVFFENTQVERREKTIIPTNNKTPLFANMFW